MCDLICDVFTCCVRSYDTNKMNVSDKIVFENEKKRKYGNKIKNFDINFHLKDGLDIEFKVCQSELMPEEAPTSFRPTVSDAYR